ncbi:MAG: hypothetical protein RLY93_07655 [Sumerlaeia bacterium]
MKASRKLLIRLTKTKRGSTLLVAMGISVILSIVIIASLLGLRNDTHQVHRNLRRLQAHYLAEGALERAKSDVLCQLTSVNFNQSSFSTLEDNYEYVADILGAERIDGTKAESDIDWDSEDVRWDWMNDSSLDLPGITDWDTDDPSLQPLNGNVRTYVTQSTITHSAIDGSFGVDQGLEQEIGYSITMTAVAGTDDDPDQAVVSMTMRHGLQSTNIFNFLLLGYQLSDCSICHLHMYGDLGQVRADDRFEVEFSWDNGIGGGQSYQDGNLYLNGNFDRVSLNGATHKKYQEGMLKNPGQDNFVYSANAAALKNQWESDKGPFASSNPFKDIESNRDDLPQLWPSVKKNLLDWFEPRAMAMAASGESLLEVKPRDNNLAITYKPDPANPSTWITYGDAAGDPVGRSIDRIYDRNKAIPLNSGLHPNDDLDGDGVPNALDADIDGDGMPESDHEEDDSGNMVTEEGELPAVYRESNGNYYWDAELSGIAPSLDDLIDNNFVSTSGDPSGTIRGVYPDNSLDSNGNPVYAPDRNLMIVGSKKNPIVANEQVVIRGDALVKGYVDGHGSIITHRNIFVPNDLIYMDHQERVAAGDWDNPQMDGTDQLGLVAGGNIVIGNYLHYYDKGGGYTKGLMGFVFGNMVNINDPGLDQSWGRYAGRDGINNKFNHMLNPAYLMDGAEGGTWIDGNWHYYNEGNLKTPVVTQNYKMTFGEGLDTSDSNPLFDPTRKHLNFNGDSHPGTKDDKNSIYKYWYISTPGLLPLGSNLISELPKDKTYGEHSGGWFDSEDLFFFTQKPKVSISGKTYTGTVGDKDSLDDVDWIKVLQGVLYADNGIVGGNLVDGKGNNFLQFYGTVIARDIQILSAKSGKNGTRDKKYLNDVGSLYYDKRLEDRPNPLNFPLSQTGSTQVVFLGLPDRYDEDGNVSSSGTRDNFVPFTLTEKFREYVDGYQ